MGTRSSTTSTVCARAHGSPSARTHDGRRRTASRPATGRDERGAHAGLPVTDDESGFGLDVYEPEFFNSLDWWLDRPEYNVTVTIPADACHDTFYYFCHIHAHMSAEIKIKGSTCPSADITRIKTDVLGGETEDSALAIYAKIRADEQPVRDPFDIACGTSDSHEWTDENPYCDDKHFLCGPGADDAFGTCLQAVDCQMHHDMAIDVPEGISKFATFARQMIPHHRNAVSMSKILENSMTPADFPTLAQEGVDTEAEAENGYDFARNLNQQIIAVQNYQIQQMQSWLERGVKDWPNLIGTPTNSEGMSPYCYAEYPLNPVCHGTGAANECPHGTECYCRTSHGMMASRRTRKLLFGTAPGGDNCYCMGAPHLG